MEQTLIALQQQVFRLLQQKERKQQQQYELLKNKFDRLDFEYMQTLLKMVRVKKEIEDLQVDIYNLFVE